MFTKIMTEKSEYTAKNTKGAFLSASEARDGDLHEFVRMLARIAAENDYNALLKKSNKPYNAPKTKGPKL